MVYICDRALTILREIALSYQFPSPLLCPVCGALLDTISGPPIIYPRHCDRGCQPAPTRADTARRRALDKRRCAAQNRLIDTLSALISMTFVESSPYSRRRRRYRVVAGGARCANGFRKNDSERGALEPRIMELNTDSSTRHRYDRLDCH